MDLNLSEQQKMLQSLAKDIAQEQIAPYAAAIDTRVDFPPEVTEILRQNQLFGLLADEASGGQGASFLEFCLMIEEISKVCPATAVMCVTQNLGGRLIMRSGSEEQRQKYVPALAGGKTICGLALKDAVGSINAELKVIRKGDRYVLNGSKHFIINGDIADIVLLLARTDDGKESCFMVEKETPGFSVSIEEGIAGCQARYLWVGTFKDCPVPVQNIIGRDGDGNRAADSIQSEIYCAAAARALGLTQSALDYSIDYAKERVVFDRLISTFEGVQAMVADGATKTEAARQLLYRAASMVDEGHRDAPRFAAMAKYFAADMAAVVTIDAVEIMGGVGLMKEYPLERAMRNGALSKMTDGTGRAQKLLIASSLL